MGRRSSGLNFRKKRIKTSDGHFKEVLVYILSIAAAIGMAFFLVINWGMKTSVIGNSMEPTLYNGQTILISRLAYLIKKPKVGDIIVFLPNGNQYTHYYVKRVL